MRTRFGPFVLDRDTRQLTRGSVELHLTPKAFELLVTLVEERPKVVPKATLLERLWPRTFVAEANVSNLIAEIRTVLGDRPRNPRWIRTAHGFGYAFCGDATAAGKARQSVDRPRCWLEWGRQRFPLVAGEHVVGRDPDVEVRVDAPTVSRRHAKLVVTAEGVMLEDLGSKNGTGHAGRRVTAPVPLIDGDSIWFGSVLLTFHVRRSLTTTATQAGPRSAHA